MQHVRLDFLPPGLSRPRIIHVLLLIVALLSVAFFSISCGGKANQAEAPPPESSPGDIPPHLNADQLKQIDQGKTDFTFAIFGDNRGSTTDFETLLRQVNGDDVLFALDNGDLVEGATVENYRMFTGQIAACSRPLLTAIGNHDGSASDLYGALFGPGYYAFTIGNSYFIVLDNANQKNLDDPQLAWLKQRLAESEAYRFRFVIMHVPLYDPRVGPTGVGHSLQDPDFAGMLNDLFDQYQVTLLLTSHIHGYYEGTWGNTPYVITGGAGAPLQGSDPQHFFYHYVRVHVSDEGVSYEVVRI